jgi:hypothetical protein
MCVLGPVLSCDCYAFSGMTDSILLFFLVLLQRGGYTHMFVVPWLTSLIGDILVYIFAPNSSCNFLYCIVLVVLVLFLLVQIHVYSVLYGLHMLIVDYSFLFGWCAPYILSVYLCQIVLHISCYMWYILCCIFRSDYLEFKFISCLSLAGMLLHLQFSNWSKDKHCISLRMVAKWPKHVGEIFKSFRQYICFNVLFIKYIECN